MATTRVVSEAQIERDQVAIAAAQRMAGAEEMPEDVAVGRRILTGEITADEAIAERFAQIDAKYGLTR
ncbi:hypothetical protein [Microbacterium lacticum]